MAMVHILQDGRTDVLENIRASEVLLQAEAIV